jgi:hypothetical protein
MKVKEGVVRCKRYNRCCMKQWIKIPKVIFKSPILKKKFTWRTFSSWAFFIKDDVNDEMSNGTLKTLIFFDKVINWNELLKSCGKLKGDHATHFWG